MLSHVAKFLVLIIVLIQLAIAVVEVLFWQYSTIHSRLGYTATEAEKVAPIVANAGLYNSFLAAGLVWALVSKINGRQIGVFFLACVVVAGMFGAITLKPTTLLLQSVPGGLALLALWLSRKPVETHAEG